MEVMKVKKKGVVVVVMMAVTTLALRASSRTTKPVVEFVAYLWKEGKKEGRNG